MAIVETVWNGAISKLASGAGTKSAGATLDTITVETQSAPQGITVDYGIPIVGPIGNGATVTINAQVRVGADGGSGTIVTKATGVKN